MINTYYKRALGAAKKNHPAGNVGDWNKSIATNRLHRRVSCPYDPVLKGYLS